MRLLTQVYNLYLIGKRASAGASAIVKNWCAVRKCVRNNSKGATVRAPHSKNPRNPTSAVKSTDINVISSTLLTSDKTYKCIVNTKCHDTVSHSTDLNENMYRTSHRYWDNFSTQYSYPKGADHVIFKKIKALYYTN